MLLSEQVMHVGDIECAFQIDCIPTILINRPIAYV